MGNGILFVAEQRNGVLKKAAFEAASESVRLGQKLGQPVTGVVVGSGIADCAAQLGAYGVGKVYAVDADFLENYSVDGYCAAVTAAVNACDPAVLILVATAMGKDLAPSLSARLDAPLASDVINVDAEAGKVQVTRPIFSGKAMMTLAFKEEDRALITLRPNVFMAEKGDESKKADVETLDAGISADALKTKVLEVSSSSEEKVELTEANIVVSGGRGMKDPSNFHLIESLAAKLGAAVGASRAVVDAGWRPHEEQVGQTGKVVTPNLYIAVGISGAIQHLAGMSSSKWIVAINKDADAPIFKVANFGIVGDAMEVVPALIEALPDKGA